MSVVLALTAMAAAWALGALGWAAVEPRAWRAARPVSWIFAAGIGVALSSGLYWAWLVLLRRTGVPYLAVEWVAIAAAGVVAFKRRPRDAARWAMPRPRQPAAWLAIVALLIATLVSLVQTVRLAPHGSWDAWEMWNVKAKFLYHAHDNWTLAFHEVSAHGDYPLLLPATVARTWCYMGADTPLGGQAVAVTCAMLLMAIAAGGMALLRGPTGAAVGVSLVLLMPLITQHFSIQYADVPLACWMLGACLAAALAWERPGERRGWLLAAGVLASAAAWTKNEGVVFAATLLTFTTLLLAWDERRRAWRHAATLWAAALPLLACVVWMKTAYDASSYMTESRTLAELVALAQDPDRHARITRLWRSIATFTTGGRLLWLGVVAWMLLRGVRVRAAAVLWIAVVLVQLAAYYAAYLLTPLDIGWQLATSAKRLLLHVAPIVALLPALLTRADESPPAPAGGTPLRVQPGSASDAGERCAPRL